MLTKITGLLAVVGALIAASFTLGGSAQAGVTDGAVAIVNQTTTNVFTNDTFTVDVEATAPTNGLGAWDLTVTFDTNVVTFDTCSFSHASNTLCQETAPGSGIVRIAGFEAVALTGTQTLATLDFTAAPTAGSTNLAIAVAIFDDGNEAPVTPAITDGVVNVQTPTPSPSPSPSPSPTAPASATPTASAGASATPTITPAGLPSTGASSDGSGTGWLAVVVLAAGLAVVSGGAWAMSRARSEN